MNTANENILNTADFDAETELDVLIVGGGGCGLCAALAAHETGASVAILERDASALGTTAMSTGLIPAAGSKLQTQAGVDDSIETFAEDILTKAKQKADRDVVYALATESAQTIDWLTENYQLPLTLVDGFTYPGHSVRRMHGMPGRSGQELMGALSQAVDACEIPLLTHATVTNLYADANGRIIGVRYQNPDGRYEDIGCRALILACCGFAGNEEMVKEYIPEISKGVFFGHPGNKGDAIRWGLALGAKVADMHAYQGHAGLAKGHGIPILWPIIMEGGVQINNLGERFSNESLGYSEQAVNVLQQPDAEAWTFFDQRLHELMLDFTDYQHALEAKAIKSASSLEEIATLCQLPLDTLAATLNKVAACADTGTKDDFGRLFDSANNLSAPFYAVKVTGALFHTQGGLEVDRYARVLHQDGKPMPNLYAGGGAARGISGTGADGYIAGNGLLTATTFGRLAGTHAGNTFSQNE